MQVVSLSRSDGDGAEGAERWATRVTTAEFPQVSEPFAVVSDTGGDGDRAGRSSRGARDEAPAVAAPGGTGTADTGAQQRSLRCRPLTPSTDEPSLQPPSTYPVRSLSTRSF